MKGRKLYEWLLTVTFIAMVGVCVYLNLFSSQKEGMTSIIVNGVMFVIVGLAAQLPADQQYDRGSEEGQYEDPGGCHEFPPVSLDEIR